MDQRFLSVFLSMESNGAAATSVPQFTWTTERDASFHDAHPSFSSGDISVTLDNDATAPMQYGISWMDSSLSGALGTIIGVFFSLFTAAVYHPSRSYTPSPRAKHSGTYRGNSPRTCLCVHLQNRY